MEFPHPEGRAQHAPRPRPAAPPVCLSKWYRAAAEEKGVALSDPEAREIVYGMPYDEWRKKHQKEASAEQKAAFAAAQPKH